MTVRCSNLGARVNRLAAAVKWAAVCIVLLLLKSVTPSQEVSRWMLGPFIRPENGNPVIGPDPAAVFADPMSGKSVHWERLHTFNPAAAVHDGRVYLLYRTEDNTGQMRIGGHTSRLGLAISDDGIHFIRLSAPVFFPAKDSQSEQEWPGGVEDPRLVEAEDGTYVLTYTQYNRKSFDIGIATSRDLIHWRKVGPAFQDASGGKLRNLRYKSGGIVTSIKDGRLIAAKINGKYWMYWGEGTVRLATSRDLVHWSAVEDSNGNPVVVLDKRSGHFDSAFPEMGPPPVLTGQSIVVIYNGKNAATDGDPELASGVYADGQALFSANNPATLLERSDGPFFEPTASFERTGQYKTKKERRLPKGLCYSTITGFCITELRIPMCVSRLRLSSADRTCFEIHEKCCSRASSVFVRWLADRVSEASRGR